MLPLSTTETNGTGHVGPSSNGRAPYDLRACRRLPALVEDLDEVADELARMMVHVRTLAVASDDLARRAEAKRRRDRRYRQHKRREVSA